MRSVRYANGKQRITQVCKQCARFSAAIFPSKPQALAGPRQLLRNICLHIYNHFETGSSANGILITHISQKLPEVKVWAKCECAKPAVCFCCLFSTWESGHLRPASGVGLNAFAHLRVCLSQQSSVESPNLEFEYGDTDALSAELSGTADRQKRATGTPLRASLQWKSVIFTRIETFHPARILRSQEHSFFDGGCAIFLLRRYNNSFCVACVDSPSSPRQLFHPQAVNSLAAAAAQPNAALACLRL